MKMNQNDRHYYKDIIPGYRYVDLMVHLLTRWNGNHALLLGQVYKYLMRAGKKGNELEDLNKAQWYLTELISDLQFRHDEDEELGRQTAEDRKQWK